MVGDDEMAAGFSVSYADNVVDVFCCIDTSDIDCIGNNQFSIDQSSSSKSGEDAEIGVVHPVSGRRP